MTAKYDPDRIRGCLRAVRLGRVYRLIDVNYSAWPLDAVPTPSRFSDPAGQRSARPALSLVDLRGDGPIRIAAPTAVAHDANHAAGRSLSGRYRTRRCRRSSLMPSVETDAPYLTSLKAALQGMETTAFEQLGARFLSRILSLPVLVSRTGQQYGGDGGTVGLEVGICVLSARDTRTRRLSTCANYAARSIKQLRPMKRLKSGCWLRARCR